MAVFAAKLCSLGANGICNLGNNPLPDLLAIAKKKLLDLADVDFLRRPQAPSMAMVTLSISACNLEEKTPTHCAPGFAGLLSGDCART